MRTSVVTLSTATEHSEERADSTVVQPAAAGEMAAIALRVRGEYTEMPGLTLTVPQAARLFGLPPDIAHAVLNELSHASVLTDSDGGTYSFRR